MTDPRLQWSKSIDHWRETFDTDALQPPVCDVLVIGSGYGGSFAARELASPESLVWVMERGREYALGEFPEDIGIFPANVNVQIKPGADLVGYSDALLELRRFDPVSVLVASGLGGGSLINAGVALRPDAALLDQAQWPHHYRKNPAGRTALWSAMAEVEQVLQVAPLSDARTLRKFQSLDALGQSMGLRAEPAPLTIASHDQVSPAGVAQKACTRCGNCFTGCNVGAKNTMATHVLPDAHRKGAEFFTGATALEVLPAQLPELRTTEGRAARWTVRMVCTHGQGDARTRREFVVHAHTVVLSAGAVGSTEILLHSPSVSSSPLLGTRFSTNGDVLAMGWGMRTLVNGMGIAGADTSVLQSPDDRVGPTITGILRASLVVPQGGRRTVLIEEGAVPSALTPLTVALGATLSLPHRYTGPEGPGYFSSDWNVDRLATPMGMERHALLMLGMGPDDADGVMSLQPTKNGRPKLDIRWTTPGTGPDSPYYQALHEWMNKAADPKQDGFQGGDYLPNPLWQALPEDFNDIAGGGGNKQGVTVHPLGGCPMGDDAANGVVDWRGTVFNRNGGLHAGLHVLDGAMLPSAVGVNPFLTIASLSLVAARSIRDALVAATPTAAVPVPAPAPSSAPRPQGRIPSPRKVGGEPVTLRFQEHLQGHWRGLAPEWLPDIDPALTLDERQRAWVVAVDVVLDVDQWVASPSTPLPGARLRIYRNPTPQDITVHPDACKGTPVLEGTGAVTLLALDAPQNGWDQAMRIVSALCTFSQRRGFKEIFQLASSGTPRADESKLGSILRHVKGFYRAARNLSFHRELIYSFTLHKPERPQFKVQAEGRKRLAYTPQAKNVWEALVEIDLTLTPHNGQNAATLSITADLIDMVRNHRLQVAQAINTPAGMIAMAAFATLWLRVIFQTHFWTFRGLSYDTLHPPKPAEHGLLKGACPPQRFALPVPRYTDDTDNTDDTQRAEVLNLELTRYAPAQPQSTARHLLMVHGLAHGGTVFTTHTADGNNMAAAFVGAGYTVWVLDHRLSNRLPYNGNDHCMDDVAALDIPAAVRHVYQAADNVPIAVFAHCVGGGAFAMATLKGWLMDPVKQASMVDKAIIHAVHPWVVPSASNQLSGSLAVLYKDLLPDGMSINPVPPSGKSEALDQVLDRLGASLPWPESEIDLHRKDQFDPLGGTATCNRMTLFYGREWVHGNLSPATHRELASLVGPASVDVFRQLFFIINRQRLTDRDGASVYLTADQIKTNWTFPILFAHGSANKVFDPRSAVRSWGRMRALQSRQAGRVVRLFMAEGYGHMDFLFGQNAHRDVYPHLCEFLHNPAAFQSSCGAEQDTQKIPSHLRDGDATAPRKPVVGPHIRLAESGDTSAPRRALVLWTEFPNDPTRTAAAPALQDANGQPLPGWSATRLQHIHLNLAQNHKTTLLHGPGAYWSGQLVEAQPGDFQKLGTLQLGWGDAGQLGHATLALTHLHWWQRWIGAPVQQPVSWLALSCRWPGTPFEGEAVDAVALQMQAHVTTSTLPVDALVMLGDQIYADATANMFKTRETDEVLAGLYRDAWGSPHAQALLASVPSYTVVDDHEYGDNWSGAVDASQDTVFVNGFEAALAYQWRWNEGTEGIAAKYRSTPAIQGPQVTGFWNAFTVGDVPFFGADTRSERQLRSPKNYRTRRMVSEQQMDALKAWLLEFKDQPKVLCSGSVMGFVERELWEAPGQCITGDSWDGYPATWRELVRFIVAEQIQHLVFLSGDYHFSGITELELHAQGSQPPVRALSVACTGWNATLPFANAVPQDFVTEQWVDYPHSDEAVRAHCLTHPMSTAHRQFSKLTLNKDSQQAWWLAVRVYDAEGKLQKKTSLPL
jgi:cholesterol oxidase